MIEFSVMPFIYKISIIFTISMIKRFVPLVRRSLTYRPAAGFCLYKGYLDPHKHNTMNHNIHNVYIELYDVGVYPEWVVNQSEPARTYE